MTLGLNAANNADDSEIEMRQTISGEWITREAYELNARLPCVIVPKLEPKPLRWWQTEPLPRNDGEGPYGFYVFVFGYAGFFAALHYLS